MKCREFHTQMISYYEGTLPENEVRHIREHLEDCPDCAGFSTYIRRHLQVIDSEKQSEPAPFLYTRIQGRMKPDQASLAGNSWKARIQPIVFSLLLLAAIISGLKFGQVVSVSSGNNYITESLASLVNEIESEPLELFLMSE